MRKAHNFIDMSGETFNSWLVIEPIPGTGKKTGGINWKAKCLECNEIYSVKGANIRSEKSKRCVKCGCGHGHAAQKGQIRTKRSPYESAIHYLYLKLRRGARKRKINWELTEKQIEKLVFKNCTYCGAAPGNVCNPLRHYGLSQKLTKEATITRNGIDRIDSSKGYEIDNVVPCCEMCNKAKLDHSEQHFLEWAKRVYEHKIKPFETK